MGIYTPNCQSVPSTEILTPALLSPVQDGGAQLSGTPGHVVGSHYFLSHLIQSVHSTKEHWAKLREGRKGTGGVAAAGS